MASSGAGVAIALVILIVIIILIIILFLAFRRNRLNQPCTIDSECGTGLVCQNNICKLASGSSGCMQNSDCANGLICNNQHICVQSLQAAPQPEPVPTNNTSNTSHENSSTTSCGCSDSCSCSSCSKSSSSSCSKSSSSSCKSPSITSGWSEETRTITDSSFSVFDDNSSYITSEDSLPKFYLYKNRQKFASTEGEVLGIFSYDDKDYVLQEDHIRVFHSSGVFLHSVRNSHPLINIVHLRGNTSLLIGLGKNGKIYYLPENNISNKFWIWKEQSLPASIGKITNITINPNESMLGVLYKLGNKHYFSTFKNNGGELDLVYQEKLHGEFTHVAMSNDGKKILFTNKENGHARMGPLGKLQKIHHLSKFDHNGELLHATDNTIYFNTRSGQFSVSRR